MLIQRLKDFIKYKSLTFASLERELSVANGTFGRALKSGGSFASSTLENILIKYPELSAEWLLRGEGCMLRFAKEATTEAIQSIAGSDELRDLIEEQRRTINEMAFALRKQAEVIAQLLEGRK